MKLVASAVFFVVVIALVFWRERRRWKKYSSAREVLDSEVPKLLDHATARYQQKYGRAPSVLEDLPPKLAQGIKR